MLRCVPSHDGLQADSSGLYWFVLGYTVCLLREIDLWAWNVNFTHRVVSRTQGHMGVGPGVCVAINRGWDVLPCLKELHRCCDAYLHVQDYTVRDSILPTVKFLSQAQSAAQWS